MAKAKKTSEKLNYLHPLAQATYAIALFAIAVILSRGTEIAIWEENLFFAIYNWPEFLKPFFFAITQLGSVFLLIVIAGIGLYIKKQHATLRLLLTGSLAYLISGVAKDLWGRTRPNELFLEVVNKDYVVRGPGFPSGHTAMAVAIAIVLGHYLPNKYSWVAPVVIIAVGLSRIYLGIHAPLDILGGFAIGWFSYSLFRLVHILPFSPILLKPKGTTKKRSKGV